jgi:hemolysin D
MNIVTEGPSAQQEQRIHRTEAEPQAHNTAPTRQTKKAANDHVIYEFLPAAIELESTPSSKAGRLIIWLIVLLFVIAVVWALVGKIDIVAVAQGKVIPSERVKQIQPLESARIKAIHVKEGQSVTAGESLITLDSALVQTDLNRLTYELVDSQQNLARLLVLNRWLANIKDLKGAASQTLTSLNLNSNQQRLLVQEQSEISSQLMSLKHEQSKLSAEAQMVQAEINKQQQVVPVLKERVDALDTLQKKSYGSKLQFLEIKQELIEAQQDLAVQQARMTQLDVSVQSIETQKALFLSEKRKQTLMQWSELKTRSESLAQEVSKTEQRMQHYDLRAPISGQVQQLAVHTVNGVVSPAQALMLIVPQNSELEVEVKLLNKDIGFVQEGQTVEVKVDTFNFTKYGYIDGELASISDDAIQDEHLGLVYSARVKLKQDGLSVNDRFVRLSPGMSVTAEVKTGTRRLIEFFLSPLLRYKQESLGER